MNDKTNNPAEPQKKYGAGTKAFIAFGIFAGMSAVNQFLGSLPKEVPDCTDQQVQQLVKGLTDDGVLIRAGLASSQLLSIKQTNSATETQPKTCSAELRLKSIDSSISVGYAVSLSDEVEGQFIVQMKELRLPEALLSRFELPQCADQGVKDLVLDTVRGVDALQGKNVVGLINVAETAFRPDLERRACTTDLQMADEPEHQSARYLLWWEEKSTLSYRFEVEIL